MSRSDTVRFRHNQAIVAAAIVTTIGALPLASARTWLLPVLLVPLAVGVWAWRAGTDADARGLRLRALAGQRHLAWEQVVGFATDVRGRAVAHLTDGRHVTLPAVRGADLPRLVAASGHELSDRPAPR